MATFAIRLNRCDHLEGFRVISTFKEGETGRDMLPGLHPELGKTEMYKICVIGYATGAACASTSVDKGFEIDLDSTPLSELKDLGIKTLVVTCTSMEKEDLMETETDSRSDAFTVLMSGARKRGI